MTPHRPKGRKIYRVHVPTQGGGWKARTTGTRDASTARAIQRMVVELGKEGTRAWDLLGQITAAKPTLSLGDLYDAYRKGAAALTALRERGRDVDLRHHEVAWRGWLEGRIADTEIARYAAYVRTLMPAHGPWWSSTLTQARCLTWLTDLPVGPSTKRKYYAAAHSFVAYLTLKGVLTADPLAALSPPPAADPAPEFYDLPTVKRIVDAATGGARALFALIYGTGIEVSAALALRRRDVDTRTWEIRGRGTKNYNRDRIAVLAEWAHPIVTTYGKGLLPDAPLFPGIDRWQASKQHRAAVQALQLSPALPLRAARHHWAVRMIRAGTPIELVARQLGHKDGVLCLKVYGRFVPTTAERRAWDRKATRKERQG